MDWAKFSTLYSRIGYKIKGKVVVCVEREEFCKRLTQLRMNKGVSARDMSLSIGQSPNYINGIECGDNYPSMATFFYICDYFGITPQEFFDIDSTNPSKVKELTNLAKTLPNDQLDNIISLVKAIKK
ncbi:MAG: helix-turn-helix transcriptional regulator [Oscillospiraceae bacterium]|nr:helix-turn-helix transcriptional regulator [Oscillospiraceae bacterium]